MRFPNKASDLREALSWADEHLTTAENAVDSAIEVLERAQKSDAEDADALYDAITDALGSLNDARGALH